MFKTNSCVFNIATETSKQLKVLETYRIRILPKKPTEFRTNRILLGDGIMEVNCHKADFKSKYNAVHNNVFVFRNYFTKIQ